MATGWHVTGSLIVTVEGDPRMANRVPADKMCRTIGGDFDYDVNQCSIPMNLANNPRSITDKGMIGFFILQVGIGVATSVLSTYFGVTLLPVEWWTAWIIFAIVFGISAAMTWYKIGNWKESLLRVAVSSVTVLAFSIIIGGIFYYDMLMYIVNFSLLSGEPLASVIVGLPISTLLSIILLEPEKRVGDDADNDFSGGATLAIFGKQVSFVKLKRDGKQSSNVLDNLLG